MYDYPIHDKRRYRFISPAEFKEVLLRWCSLTKEFIDWVAEQNFKIVYRSDLKEGTGSVWWGSFMQINVSSLGDARLVDKVLVHEIIHVAVPCQFLPERVYEEAIDEVAEVYLENQEFMEYLKKRLPSEKSQIKLAFLFPDF